MRQRRAKKKTDLEYFFSPPHILYQTDMGGFLCIKKEKGRSSSHPHPRAAGRSGKKSLVIFSAAC